MKFYVIKWTDRVDQSASGYLYADGLIDHGDALREGRAVLFDSLDSAIKRAGGDILYRQRTSVLEIVVDPSATVWDSEFSTQEKECPNYHWYCTKCGDTESVHRDDDLREIRACQFCSGQKRVMTLKEGARFEQARALGLPFHFDQSAHAPGEE